MRLLVIEVLMAVIIALCIYYGLLPLFDDSRWIAAIAAGLGGFIAMRIGKKLS